jgi:hypothetical protein
MVYPEARVAGCDAGMIVGNCPVRSSGASMRRANGRFIVPM